MDMSRLDLIIITKFYNDHKGKTKHVCVSNLNICQDISWKLLDVVIKNRMNVIILLQSLDILYWT